MPNHVNILVGTQRNFVQSNADEYHLESQEYSSGTAINEVADSQMILPIARINRTIRVKALGAGGLKVCAPLGLLIDGLPSRQLITGEIAGFIQDSANTYKYVAV